MVCSSPIRARYWLWSLKTHRNGLPAATSFTCQSPHELFLFAISCFNPPYTTFLLNLGANIIWYLQFHFVRDKLFTSIWIPPVFMWLANHHNFTTGIFYFKLKHFQRKRSNPCTYKRPEKFDITIIIQLHKLYDFNELYNSCNYHKFFGRL